MIVVCIDNNITPNLTLGKKYNIRRVFFQIQAEYYELIGDNGYVNSYIYSRFKILSEVRRNKLKKIC